MSIPYSKTLIGSLQWYSVLIVLGILIAAILAMREEKRLGLPKDTALDVTLIVVPCGIIGARLYYVAMTWELFAADPISILYVWQGGVAIYGGVIGGALGALVYAKRKKISFLRLADIVAPGLLLAQAIGRWGNYFNMEAYGPAIADPAFCFFPMGVQIWENGQWVWHMATFFYESLWNALGFAALWLMRRKRSGAGEVFCWYLLIYGAGRFIIEQLREDSLYLAGFRVSQYLSLALCATAAGWLLWRAASGRRGWYAASLTGVLTLIARWMFLDSALIYTLLMAAAFVTFAYLLTFQPGNVKARGLWLLLPFALDAAGEACAIVGLPISAAFAGGLHTVLCSVTLPMYVFLLTAREERQAAAEPNAPE